MKFKPLSEAMKEIRSGALCEITYVTLDKKRKTGGEIVTLQCQMIKPPSKKDRFESQFQADGKTPPYPKKINVFVHGKHRYTGVHPRLITHFNGVRILY